MNSINDFKIGQRAIRYKCGTQDTMKVGDSDIIISIDYNGAMLTFKNFKNSMNKGFGENFCADNYKPLNENENENYSIY